MEEKGQTETKRASLLGLPPELRLSIYQEVFRIKSWEAHHARTRDLSAPKRRLSDQCPICQSIPRDRSYLYPTCRLVLKEGQLFMQNDCYTPSSREERCNRAALLRVCRSVSDEALDCLYKNTLFVLVEERKDPPWVRGNNFHLPRIGFAVTRTAAKMRLSAIQNLYVRIYAFGLDSIMEARIAEIMSRIWCERGSLQDQLQHQVHCDFPNGEMVIEVSDGASSHSRLRIVFRWTAACPQGDIDKLYSLISEKTVPPYLAIKVEPIIKPEDP